MKPEKVALSTSPDALEFLHASDQWLKVALVCVARAHVCRERAGVAMGVAYMDARESLEARIADERENIRLESSILERLAGERGDSLGTR